MINRMSWRELLEATRFQNGYVKLWVLLSSVLISALYLAIVCIFKMAVVLETTAPIAPYFAIASLGTAVLVFAVLLAGLLTAFRLGKVHMQLCDALLRVREGDLSTRISFAEDEGLQDLETAFNQTIEVLQQRLKNTSGQQQ